MALVKFCLLDRVEGSPEVSEVFLVLITHRLFAIVPLADEPHVICGDSDAKSPEQRVADFIEPGVGEWRHKRPEVLARGVSDKSADRLLLDGVWLRS